MSYLKLLRPSHWIKNFFVLMPVFFAAELSDADRLTDSLMAFVAFCAVASAIYIINDLRDAEADRKHPEKKNRPIVSGAISGTVAIGLASTLLLGGTALGYLISTEVAGGLIAYLIFNLAYSFGLKKVAILDVTIISLGFVLRVLVGGWAANVEVSHWLIIDTFLLAMILGLSKRRAELNLLGNDENVRASLKGYNENFLDLALIMMSGVTLVSYIMYCVSDDVVMRLDTDHLYTTSVFVLIGLTRYAQQIIVARSKHSPVKMLLRDQFLQVVVIGWIITFAYIIYG